MRGLGAKKVLLGGMSPPARAVAMMVLTGTGRSNTAAWASPRSMARATLSRPCWKATSWGTASSARCNRHLGESEVLSQLEGVACGLLERYVPADRCDRNQVDVRVAVREKKRERIVQAGVTVEKNPERHASTLAA